MTVAQAVDLGQQAAQRLRDALAELDDAIVLDCGAGLPQRYGTQMREHEGAYIPQPIEDEAKVDARRAAVGLEPLVTYVARFRS